MDIVYNPADWREAEEDLHLVANLTDFFALDVEIQKTSFFGNGLDKINREHSKRFLILAKDQLNLEKNLCTESGDVITTENFYSLSYG